MVVEHDALGVAVVRPTIVDDASRHLLRKAIHKVLPECPAAIVVDLANATHIPRLVQMTLVSLAIEAAQEPATPLAFCTADPDVARDLTGNGPAMRVFTDLAEARRSLLKSGTGIPWIHRTLGSGSDAPGAAAGHVAEACLAWGLSAIQEPARTVAFHLVSLARGPYELHLTVSLRPAQQFLINVRNYSTASKSSPDRTVRVRLTPADEARVIARGASACGRLVTGAGVAWWAILNGPTASS